MADAHRSRWTAAFTAALAGVGLFVGLFGPLVVDPKGNLGPMLALITIPLGAAVGCVVGVALSRFTRNAKTLGVALAFAAVLYGAGGWIYLRQSPRSG